MLARIHRSVEKRDEGFTLIELLVVIIIIGILAAIAIPVFLSQRQKGYDASAKADLHNAALAEEAYFAANGSYAPLSAVRTADPGSVKLSPNDTIITFYVDAKKGYCMGAMNSNGSPPPTSQAMLGQSTILWWYDSQSGGLQPADTTVNLAPPYNLGCPATNGTAGNTLGFDLVAAS